MLGGEFPPADRDAWLAAVRAVLLKGRPEAGDDEAAVAFAKQLVTATEDGFDIQPLYDAASAPDPRAVPGGEPFVRSTHAAPRDWEIRQRVWSNVEGSSALSELEQGATGILLEVSAGVDGATLDHLLDGVLLDLAPVSLSTPADDDGIGAAQALLGLWESRSIGVDDRTGTLGVDPIGAWARTGGRTDLRAGLVDAARLVRDVATGAPRARTLVADGTLWHDAGATDGQELAWAIAAAVTSVRELCAADVDLGTALASIEFRWAATADQFATITKLRAARLLWSRVTEIAGDGQSTAPMFQHADASRPMLTRYDTWVNALRSTVACFASAVGGADAVTLPPHDLLLEPGGSPLGRRIARNTQSVLLLESNLARVVDIAGGSWYVEQRTDELAAAAWRELQRIEESGGLIRAVEEGNVRAALTDVIARRSRAVATRRRPLTGLTEFPNIHDPIPPPLPRRSITADAPFEPFALRRLGDDVEHVRGRADLAATETGIRPTLFLATLGGPAASTTRATFAKNFFEVGGIRTCSGEVADFDPTLTTVACLCSSDAVYATDGSAAIEALRASGATTVYVAGRGLGLDGVDAEIGVGSDVLDVLTRTLDEMGVAVIDSTPGDGAGS